MDCECAVVEAMISGVKYVHLMQIIPDEMYRMGSKAFMHGGWKL